MKKVKKYWIQIISFIIPFITLSLLFLIQGCFTKKAFFQSDSLDQYYPLFGYLKDIISGKQSVFYSFSKGFGGSMIGTFAYYLASPLNLITCLFPKDKLYLSMLILVLIKISLSATTMNIFLKDKIENNIFLLLFSVCYSLCAYNVNYHFNIMWLDGVYLAPLVLLGIEKIIDKNKKSLYIITLFLSIWCNYYIGFMICIFSFIYFVYYLINSNNNLNKEFVLKRIISFIVSSLLSVLISVVLLYPTLLELMSSSKGNSTFFKYDFKINFNFFDFLSKGYLSSQNGEIILNYTGFFWYSGIIIFASSVLYFINKKISKKEKISSLIVIIIFIVSFMCRHVNMIWHGFSEPVGFNYRYSFLFSFFLILLSVKNMNSITEYKLKDVLIIMIIFVLNSLIIILLNYQYLNIYMVYGTVGLFIIYIVFLISYSQIDYKQKFISLILLFLTLSEIFFQNYFIMKTYNYLLIQEVNDYLKSYIEVLNDKSFYRIGGEYKNTSNNNLLLGNKKVNSFLSTNNDKLSIVLANFGVNSNSNIIYYSSNSGQILDSIFSVKYIYSRFDYFDAYQKIDNFKYYPFNGLLYGIMSQKGLIYKNDDALSLAFMANNNIMKFEKTTKKETLNPFNYQNILFSEMTNSSNEYFKLYDINPLSANEAKYNINNDNELYFYIGIDFFSSKTNVDIYINDEKVKNITSAGNQIFKIPNKYNGEEITLSYKVNGSARILSYPVLYYFDQQAFDEDIEKLKNNQLEITDMGNTYVKGKINVEDNNILFTSIPYEKGWELKVDGKKTKIIPVARAFLGAKLPKGEHEIELTFHTPGLIIGIITSIIGLILSILFVIKGDKFVNMLVNLYIKFEEVILYLIVGATTMVISVLSYAFLSKILHLHYQVCNVISWIIAVTFAYILNKIIVFKSKTNTKKELFKEIYEFIKYRIISLVGELLFMYLFVSIINMNDLIAKVIVQILVVIANYIFSKVFIFKRK